MPERIEKHCQVCNRLLNNPADVLSEDCDGECLACAGDVSGTDSEQLTQQVEGAQDE